VYPKNNFLIMSNHPISVTIGPAFSRRKGQSHDEFTAQVREWFIQQSDK
jgi:hypothetical protein